MKKGEIKSALNCLAERGGVYTGNSFSILRALSFDGGWREFQELMGPNLSKTEDGLYMVRHPEFETLQEVREASMPQISLEAFALCATNYLLGEGDADDFQVYEAPYSRINDTVVHLSTVVDPDIGKQVYPPETEHDILMTEVERALFYVASDGQFQVYGTDTVNNIAA